MEWWWYYSEITDFYWAEQQNCHRLGKFCFVMAACNLRNAAAFEFSVEEKPWISDSLFSTYALLFQVTAKTTKTRHPCELPTQSPLPVASTTSKWRSSAKGGMGKCYKGWNYWVVWCRKVNSRSRQNVTDGFQQTNAAVMQPCKWCLTSCNNVISHLRMFNMRSGITSRGGVCGAFNSS